jgi:hypothetical protein
MLIDEEDSSVYISIELLLVNADVKMQQYYVRCMYIQRKNVLEDCFGG